MEKVKNKRNMREVQHKDPFANEKGTGPIRHKAGTKPARKAKKYEAEMSRKEERSKAHEHMKKHGG
jgi:hypothetical protein